MDCHDAQGIPGRRGSIKTDRMSATHTFGATEPKRALHHGRWDFVAMSAGTILLAAAAFLPSLVNPMHRRAPLSPLIAVHGVIFTGWLLFFVVQATLIATSRAQLHRRLGMISVGFAVLMVVIGYKAAVALTSRGFDLSGDLNVQADPLANLVFPLGDLVTFVVLFAMGLVYRHRPAIHKRFMLLATVGMMTPSSLAHFVGHNFRSMPGVFLPLLAIVFFSPALYDRMRWGRFHRVTLWGGILLFSWGNARALVIGPSAAWKQFAAWLIR